jgi:hypothetical protein
MIRFVSRFEFDWSLGLGISARCAFPEAFSSDVSAAGPAAILRGELGMTMDDCGARR